MEARIIDPTGLRLVCVVMSEEEARQLLSIHGSMRSIAPPNPSHSLFEVLRTVGLTIQIPEDDLYIAQRDANGNPPLVRRVRESDPIQYLRSPYSPVRLRPTQP